MNPSVTIIGGADGPTRVFWAGHISPWSIVKALVGIVAVIGLVLALLRKRKK